MARDSGNKDPGTRYPGICPECGGTTMHRYRPFCSRRCADVDLSRWLRGAYAIAGGNADEDEDGDDANAADLARKSLAGPAVDDDDANGSPGGNDGIGGSGGPVH